MEINFYLRPLSEKDRTSKDMLRPIYMYVSFASNREPIPTGIKVLESVWDIAKQKADIKKGRKEAAAINIALEEWEQKAIDFDDKYKPATPKLLKRLMQGVEVKEQVNEKEFFVFFENYMNSSVPGGSIHNYRKCLVHLKSFSNKVYRITWEILTAKFYQDYIKYLSGDYTNFRTGKKGILNSTMAKDIWTLKDICHYAKRHGIEVPVDVEDFEKPSNSQTKRVLITEDRLKELEAFDFSSWELYTKFERMKKIMETKIIPNILKVRDLYVFSFYTGLAHKELMKITRDMVVRDKIGDREIFVIDFARTKTKRYNAIPLNAKCLEIIERYKAEKNLLPYFANSQYNRICKNMFKTAKFNQLITLSRWSGNKEITQTFEEWELLTSHTGRHSAATNILKKTGDLTLVRDMLGHSSVKTTEIYAKNDRETLNTKLLKALENE